MRILGTVTMFQGSLKKYFKKRKKGFKSEETNHALVGFKAHDLQVLKQESAHQSRIWDKIAFF